MRCGESAYYSEDINDINRIVSVYGLSVKEVKTETPYFININDFYTHNAKITRKYVVIPDRVLEATIYIIYLLAELI